MSSSASRSIAEKSRTASKARAGQPALESVRVWTEEVVIPTYEPAPPDKNPMFLEKRVYQGGSGKVYPLPFTERIAEGRTDRKWKAIWLENEFLRVMVLPEIGGRVHVLQDRTDGYDLVYRQPVIKPALVGLAGPWVSGGIEFNWPQHHRPATFLPVDTRIERHDDGSVTIWCGDHDPMARMKGLHGVCLHPDKAYLELKVRAYNRTPMIQTFLWWANVGVRVHEAYQSFFPPDVASVADHAKRAMSAYPLCQGFYYGVNYGGRGRKGVPPGEAPSRYLPPHCLGHSPLPTPHSPLPHYPPTDLSFYANIPTPCSYMAVGSREDFFGGYDHSRQAGLVHLANHHIAPGKKQWTWGNHQFGYAWDRNLTDPDETGAYAPYIELMAGVYTDNQPDFSFLQPGETKTWSQYWYPIRQIGPARHANLHAALSLAKIQSRARVGVSVSSRFKAATVTLLARGRTVWKTKRDLRPGTPVVEEVRLPKGTAENHLLLRVTDARGREIITCTPKPPRQGQLPKPATEPPAPADIASTDELYLTGLHLEQYRHATRCPTLYWREALRRDPSDARCNNALGLWHLRRGEFRLAEGRFRRAIERLTVRNPNPYDGEPYYNLGLALCYQLDSSPPPAPDCALFEEAYAAFAKATWNQAWQSAGYHALAELDCRRHDWPGALDHLDRSLRLNSDNLRARNLKALVLRRVGRDTEADALLAASLGLDPLDWWARHLLGQPLACDTQTKLDLALDFARAGFHAEAVTLLTASPAPKPDDPRELGAAPLLDYYLGWLQQHLGDRPAALTSYARAAARSPDYCFPARLEEVGILQAALAANRNDARALYYLGNLLYDRRRHPEAIACWEGSARLDSAFAITWRNLGIGYFNIRHQPAKARAAYDKAFAASPGDARLLYERDQLWKRARLSPIKRLRELEKHAGLVRQRDDLSIELCALYNQAGQHGKALDLIRGRHFQPWEGGEGQALGQHVRTHLALGRGALARGDAVQAQAHFQAALTTPPNLGEARHLLANQSDLHYWMGCAWAALGDRAAARRHWLAAATFKGDFQEMSVRAFSEMTFYSALSWQRLGRPKNARRLLEALLAHARALQRSPARIDYFATSLPALLLFEDDLQFRQETTALFLQAQAHLGLGRKSKARSLLGTVLRRDPNHPLAADLVEEIDN